MADPPIFERPKVAREILGLRAEAVREIYGESVRQMFAVTEYGTPDPVGSCVLLAIKDRKFLLTAAHVLDHAKTSSLYVGGVSELVLLKGESHRTEETGTPAEDRLDFAFVAISPEVVDALGPVHFLAPTNLDPSDDAGIPQVYVAVGFPWRKTKKDLDARRMLSPMVTVTMVSDPGLFQTLEISQHTHLVLPFDRERMFLGQKQHTAPNPEGMSGGGLWRSDRLGAVGQRRAVGKLVGILTRYKDTGTRHMKAARISLVLEGIRSVYPELSSDLPTGSRSKISVRQRTE
jgi:hypothetical protein